MTEQWPPPGHSFSYKVNVCLDGKEPQSFDVTLPSSLTEFNLATVRVGRHGGPNDRDQAFRELLYPRIGAVTVAGGHVEAAMKRLLILLKKQGGKFSLVDKVWSDLHKMLATESRRQGERQEALRPILQWALDNRLKERRDNVVHSYWWDFDGVAVTRSRFFRREDGANIVSTLEELDEDVNLLSEYARRLDGLLGEDWPRAMLPQ